MLARHIIVSKGRPGLKSKIIQIEPAYYELILKSVPKDNFLQSVYAIRGRNIIEKAELATNLDKIEFHNAFSIVIPHPINVPSIWAGDIYIEGIREVKGDLIIRPGTTINMAENASLIISGKLLAEGTKDRPIRFIPSQGNEIPWGAVIIKGSDSDGSKLKYCEFSGGSGYKGDLFEYSAMLSIHGVKDMLIANCYFHDNKVVDDMVHAVYSDITFSDSVFEHAKFDALDLDISTSTIERCKFIHSGNDGIDLMTSEAVVRDTLLKSNLDKGISIGENSNVFVYNSQIFENQIGLQSKDISKAILYNVTLEKNKKAMDAYKKNWRYGGGGTIHLYKSKVLDNEATFSADKKSSIWVYDSYVKENVTGNKQIIIDDTVDNRNEKTARIENFWQHPSDRNSADLFKNYWLMVNPKQRGAVTGDY